MPDKAPHEVKPFPLLRRLTVDSARQSRKQTPMHGLVEFDVAAARQRLAEHRDATGESISFTAYIIACLGRAIAAHRAVHAMRRLDGKLVIFEDADITVMIEIDAGGYAFALAHIIHAANRRSVREIHNEIRGVQARKSQNVSRGQQTGLRAFLLLPAFVRDFFYFLLRRSPHFAKRNIGTAFVTAIGMFGTGGGWGMAPTMYPLGVVLGGIAERPVRVAGEWQPREFLHVTLTFDHDIVDGAPATRFARTFGGLVESAELLAVLNGPDE